MRRHFFGLVIALGWGLAAWAGAQPAAGPQLPDATALDQDRHVLLTAPMGSEALARDHAARLAAEVGGDVVVVWPLSAIDAMCYVIRLPEGSDREGATAKLEAQSGVLTAQPLNTFELFEGHADEDLLPIQDSLRTMNVLRAHAYATGASVTLALIDSAVDLTHRDLADQNIVSRDFVDSGAPPSVAEHHGTAMAALIAADARNNFGMIGVAPDARLLALRACWREGRRELCNSFSVARAVNFALSNGADIINLSFGGGYDPLLAAMLVAAEDKGIVVVAARGPDPLPRFPASFSTAIDASALGGSPQLGNYPAPGREVISAKPGDRYDFYSGDSVAAAHVSGVAALLLQLDPGLSPRLLRDTLSKIGRKRSLGIDACLAMQAVSPSRNITC